MSDPHKRPAPLLSSRLCQKTIRFDPTPLWYPRAPSQSLLLRKPANLTLSDLPPLKTFFMTVGPSFANPIVPLGLPPKPSRLSLPEWMETEKEIEGGPTYSKKDGWHPDLTTSYKVSLSHEWDIGCRDCLYTGWPSVDGVQKRLAVGVKAEGVVSSANAFIHPLASEMEANLSTYLRWAVARQITLTAPVAFGAVYDLQGSRFSPQAKGGLELEFDLGKSRLDIKGNVNLKQEGGKWGWSFGPSISWSFPIGGLDF